MDIFKRSLSVWVFFLLSGLDTMWINIDEKFVKDGKVIYLIFL